MVMVPSLVNALFIKDGPGRGKVTAGVCNFLTD
jgi:hypothetical protein